MVELISEHPKVVKKCPDYETGEWKYFPDKRFYDAGMGVKHAGCKHSKVCVNAKLNGWGFCYGNVYEGDEDREIGFKEPV